MPARARCGRSCPAGQCRAGRTPDNSSRRNHPDRSTRLRFASCVERRTGLMTIPRALVLRAPGINCDRETALGCRLAGFETDLVHINQLIRQPEQLLRYHFLVVPGGFAYGDDLGAGTLLAKNLSVHLARELEQFIDEGRPVLGICNGFQVLVRAGLLPGAWTN